MKTRLKYFFYCLLNFFQEKKCPFCHSTDLNVVDSKFVFSRLLMCNCCDLQHRHPKDSKSKNSKFYNEEYEIDTYLITDLPNDQELKRLNDNNFSKYFDMSKYFECLNLFTKENLILDYGCSWGYNVKKLSNSGYNVLGYELAKNRAQFGEEKLNVKIFSDVISIPNDIGIIVSSHVIEHLYDINEYFDLCRNKLSKDGYLVTFCPNGDNSFRLKNEKMWKLNWGNIHPNHLTINFFKKKFKNNPYLILTGDWHYNLDEISSWDEKSQKIGEIKNGMEILAIVIPNRVI